MADFFVFLLTLMAVAVGFFFGYRARAKKTSAAHELPWTQKRYVEGLTYLLNEQTDESLDAFIASMEVSPQTLDVHLSLGGLLRRKGEFARALKVHENLLRQQVLSSEHLFLVKYELAEDYVASGLLDRAELSLGGLVDSQRISASLRQAALEKLVFVYQDTKDWLKAIDIADRLTEKKFSAQSDKWREYKAQFACELAEIGRANNDWQETRHWAMAAHRYDNNCVRATLILATIDIEEKKFPAAIATLKRIPQQGVLHLSEMLPPLVHCYRAANDEEHLINELEIYLKSVADASALKILFDLYRHYHDDQAALSMLGNVASTFDTQREIFELSAVLDNENKLSVELRSKFADKVSALLDKGRSYLCQHCGWEAAEMHWLCPSCNRWASVTLQH